MPREIARQGADLARRASKMLAGDATGVVFSVSHWVDRQGMFSDIYRAVEEKRSGDDTALDHGWTETLTSAAWGHAFAALAGRIGTTRGEWVRRVEVDTPPVVVPPGHESDDHATDTAGYSRHGCINFGRARPNPLLLYEGVETVEMSLHLPVDDERPTLADARALGFVAREIAHTASVNKAPLSFLQAPTADPVAERPSLKTSVEAEEASGDWRPAWSWSLRFGIGLRPEAADRRYDVYSAIVELAQRYGLGLALGDRRGDSRAGHWLRVSDSDGGIYTKNLRNTFRDRLHHVALPPLAVPLTFVGPARTGTTRQVSNALLEAELYVLSASVGVLKNLAFISMLVPCIGDGKDLEGKFVDLRKKLYQLSPHDRPPPDYHCFEGPCRRIETTQFHDSYAAWAGWRMVDQPEALSNVVASLRAALESVAQDQSLKITGIGDVNIDYIVCRRLESGYLTGRAKLSVPRSFALQGDNKRTIDMSNMICRRVAAAWQTELSELAEAPQVEVEFSWHEPRLGRWHSLVPGLPS